MNYNNQSNQKKRLVGVVGGAASGKDTVAGIFESNGYSHVSSSDLVRDEIARRGLKTSRELQTSVANELRFNNGANYWLEQSIKRLGESALRGVISGLYSPGEGDALRKDHNGYLVSVVLHEGDDALDRYNRLLLRSSGDRDNLSFQEFLIAHDRENGGTNVNETNLSELHRMADFVIYNSSDMESLVRQTEDVIKRIED